jgi:hypothetical protein
VFVVTISDACPYFCLIPSDVLISKNDWTVSMPFAFAIFAILVGSTPTTLIPVPLNPLRSVPSFEPISITRSFGLRLYFLISPSAILTWYSTSSFVTPLLYGYSGWYTSLPSTQ